MKFIEEEDVGPEPVLPPGFTPSTFIEATVVSSTAGIDTNYTADIKRDWCIVTGTSFYA
jgi:hypothetical protein